jgi:pimeloyl-ACP methyl ester carboxylesterase
MKKFISTVSIKIYGLILKLGTPLFPNAIKKLILMRWRKPPRFAMPEREKIAIRSAVANDTQLDDSKIRTWSWGHGPTVLFIHGWGGRGTQVCSHVEALNQAGFKVVGLDLPAHGESTGSHTNYIGMSTAITAILKNIDNLHSVITHSFGGLLFAHTYQDMLPLKNIVFICPPKSYQTAFDFFSKTLPLPREITNQIINTVKDATTEDTYSKFITVKNVMRITQPVLVVHDKNDDVVPFTDGEEVAKNIKNCIFYASEGLGHHRILHDQEIIKVITKFISKDRV